MQKKPPIAAKPRNIQKTNYVVIPSQSYSEHPQNIRSIPTPTRQLRNADEQQIFSSSSPTYQIHYFSTSTSGECTNDVQQQQLKRQNFNNGIAYTNGASEEHLNDNNGCSHRIDNKSFNHTPSHSFDSSGSSSSGGFREVDYVAKTKALYEPHNNDNSNSNNHEIPSSYPIPSHHHQGIGHSKIQEIQSKLLQQKQQIIQNHVSSEQIAINRAQYQKSTQELEKLFGLRVAVSEKEIRHQPQLQQHPKVSIVNQEKPAVVRRMSCKSNGDDEVDHSNNLTSLTAQLTLNISKHIQQKLQAEMKQQCEIIKEKYLIEKVPVQLHYCDFAVDFFLLTKNLLNVIFYYLMIFFNFTKTLKN